MSREENVINYYLICNKLKNTIREGFKIWNVKRDRIESVAEHVYSTQMLALAMKSEYEYDIDILKVINMLAVHEVGECAIGDIPMFYMTEEEKKDLERAAVHKILGNLLDGDYIEELFLEFDEKENKTKEALFAFQCDKMDFELQTRIYDEEGCIDLNDQENNKVKNNQLVKSLLDQGMSCSEMMFEFGRRIYPYDENFRSVSEYASKNLILKKQP